MKFEEAIKAIKDGKKVTRTEGQIIYTNPQLNRLFYYNHPSGAISYSGCIIDFEADDWEVYEEPKKSLSDKEHWCDINKICYRKPDVKEALKEFIDCFNKCASGVISKGYAYDRIKEIFGGDLID